MDGSVVIRIFSDSRCLELFLENDHILTTPNIACIRIATNLIPDILKITPITHYREYFYIKCVFPQGYFSCIQIFQPQ